VQPAGVLGAGAPTARVIAVAGNRYVAMLSRLLLAAVFLISAYGKMVDLERYSVDAVYQFDILPLTIARPLGLMLPFIELLCGLGLLFGVFTRLSAAGVALMSLAFFIAKELVLAENRELNCGCFGAVTETLASSTIFMDIPMMLLASFVLFAPDRSRRFAAVGRWLPCDRAQRLRWIW
jgi:putative oxidoreductase